MHGEFTLSHSLAVNDDYTSDIRPVNFDFMCKKNRGKGGCQRSIHIFRLNVFLVKLD